MSTLPRTSEAMPRRVSSLSTYFITRVVIAVLLSGLDGFVICSPAATTLQSIDNPWLFVLVSVAVIGIVFSLAKVWYKTLRYRTPLRPHTRNPFL